MFRSILAIALLFTATLPAAAQSPEMWHRLAASVEPGSLVKVRLSDGRRFTAVLVEARSADMSIEPKTRIPVPVQSLAYSDIAAMERVSKNGGVSPGKAVAIGAAAGAGAFFGILLFALAAFSD
jgi:hypothetical protein